MNVSSYRVWIMALCAIIISLAAIAMSTYSMARDIQGAPSVAATQRSLRENFNRKLVGSVESCSPIEADNFEMFQE